MTNTWLHRPNKMALPHEFSLTAFQRTLRRSRYYVNWKPCLRDDEEFYADPQAFSLVRFESKHSSPLKAYVISIFDMEDDFVPKKEVHVSAGTLLLLEKYMQDSWDGFAGLPYTVFLMKLGSRQKPVNPAKNDWQTEAVFCQAVVDPYLSGHKQPSERLYRYCKNSMDLHKPNEPLPRLHALFGADVGTEDTLIPEHQLSLAIDLLNQETANLLNSWLVEYLDNRLQVRKKKLVRQR